MLQQLHIKNFALIEDATISFTGGFSVITGETGAGKSIVLDALGLLLGNRADLSALQNKEHKCVVEATFKLDNYDLHNFFEEQDLDFEPSTIIRREIAKNGKSRAFVNDTPVVLTVLKQLGEKLLDVHSQNANLLLDEDWFYFDLLDGFAGTISDRKNYLKLYLAFKAKQKLLQTKVANQQAFAQELSFKEFQLKELEAADLKEGEQEELEQELDLLSNADKIKQQLSIASNLLQNKDESALELLKTTGQALQELKHIGDDFKELSERLSSLLIELNDITSDLEDLNEKVVHDPQRLEWVDNRLGELFSLVKKFAVVDVKGLLERQNELEQEVGDVIGGEEQIEQLKLELQQEEALLLKEAKQLTKHRKATLESLEQLLLQDLSAMKMTNAQLKITVEETALNQFGCDDVTMLFNANKGGALQNLKKVASGGEFSRIMLSLKRRLSSKKQLPTILFDEIDTGVSGEVADKMASIMQEMSSTMQVIAITHLPQIASKGKVHFKVSKNDTATVTTSNITQLTNDERIEELAKMLSGSVISAAAIKNAKELLG